MKTNKTLDGIAQSLTDNLNKNVTVKKWKINKNGIMRSLKAVIEKKDITKLTKDAYNFIHITSGFIAHYNINGFMSHYENVADFVRNLQNSSDINNPDYYTNDSYFSKGDQAEYYAAKSEIYNFIKKLVSDIEVKDVKKTYTVYDMEATY